MDSASFLLTHFDRLAEAPGGIAKLRALVLQLAVTGKVVAQNPADEPTSKRFRKATPRPSEGPLPLNWECWRMLDLVAVQYGFAFDSNKFSESREGVPLIRIRDIRSSSTTLRYVGEFDPTYLVEPGDYLVGMDGDFNIAEWRGPKALLNQRVCRFRNFTEALLPKFLFYCIQQHLAEIHAATSFVTVKHLSAKQLNLVVLSLPPLAEQRRIVAKVEELMGLCDALEAAQQERETVRTLLRTSALHRLTAPDTDSQSAAFVLKYLPRLTNEPEDIEHIRHSVLQLAVQGKIAPQNPGEESALALLTKLKQAKAAVRKKKPDATGEDEIEARDGPFTIPSNWIWAHFPELGEFGRGKSKHRPRNDPSLYTNGKYPLVQTGDVARSGGRITTFAKRYNEAGLAQSKLWPRGTLCITIAANIADSGLLDLAACFPDSVVGFIPATGPDDARYFDYFIRTAKADLLAFAPATAQKNINLEILSAVLIPLPPLAEQRRIVAKVDELMAVLDQLEATLTTARTTSENLLAATLAGLHAA